MDTFTDLMLELTPLVYRDPRHVGEGYRSRKAKLLEKDVTTDE